MAPIEPTTERPLVLVEDGLLRCPHCNSYDLMPGEPPIVDCEDCGKQCLRFADQCVNCGARGAVVQEQIARPQRGQRPSEAPRKLVTTCEHCGYTTR